MKTSSKPMAALLALGLVLFPVGPLSASGEKKWGPHVDIDGKLGTRFLGRGDLFVPLWQNEATLMFADLRVMGDDDENIEGNIGAAMRHLLGQPILGEQWIAGGYGFFDIRRSQEFGSDHTFFGGTLGGELMSEDFDLRTNVYIPESDAKSTPNATKVTASSTGLTIQNGAERALYGFDSEVGVRLPFAEDSLLWDTRVYVGGYYFDAPGFTGFGGPKGRLEMRIHDLPYLSPGARLVLGGEVAWDHVRNTQGFGSIQLRIPMYGWFGGGHGSGPDGRMSKLERRMTDPIVREIDIVTTDGTKGSEPALNPKTGNEITKVRYAAAGGTGDGLTPATPDRLVDAVDDAADDNVVVALASGGTFAENVNLFDGQILVGGGGMVWVKSERGGLYSWKAPGSRPTLADGSANSDDIVDMERNNYVGNIDFDLTGLTDYAGIRGSNALDAMVAYSSFRNGYRGIYLDGDDPTHHLTVMDSLFEENDTGVYVQGYVDTHISDSRFSGNLTGFHAIVEENDEMANVHLERNLFENNDTGARLEASEAGRLVGHVMENRFVMNSTGLNLEVDGADGGSDETINVMLDVVGNQFIGNTSDGFKGMLDDDRDSDGASQIVITTNFRDNRFIGPVDTDAGGIDIEIDADNDTDTAATRLESWKGDVIGNEFIGFGGSGFRFDFSLVATDANGNSYDFDWEISDNRFEQNWNAIEIAFEDGDSGVNTNGGVISASFDIHGNTFLNNDNHDLDVGVSDIDSDTNASFNTWVRDNTFLNKGGPGTGDDTAIRMFVDDSWQSEIDIVGNQIVGGSDGLDLRIVSDGPNFLTIGGNRISGVSGTGIYLSVFDSFVSSVKDGMTLDNTVTGSGEADYDFDKSTGNIGTVRINGEDLAVESP